MRYSQQAYIKAEDELKARRQKAEDEYNAHLSDVASLAPQITEITNKIRSVNAELLKAITTRSEDRKPSDIVMEIRNNNMLAHRKKVEILRSIGFPEDYLDHKYQCDLCKDTGFVDSVRCRCFDELLEKLTISGLVENCDIELHDFDEFRLEYYPKQGDPSPFSQMSIILNNCINYANDFSADSPSLFFYGNTGLGKTMISSCIAKAVISKGYTVIFRSILKVFEDALAEHFGKKEGNTVEKLCTADLVILDDLGSEFGTQSDPILYRILNDRINSRKPTIISSNLSLQELNGRYNQRIVSRLLGSFERYPFVGNDVRFIRNKPDNA